MKVDAQIEEDYRQTIYYLKGYSYLKFYCQKQSNQKPTANTVSTLRRTTLSWVRGDIKELLSVNDINEINHIWTAEMNRKMKKWSSQCTQFMQLREEGWKKVLNFFQASSRNCINCVHCDDHFFIFIKNFYSSNLLCICPSLLETNLNKAKYSSYCTKNCQVHVFSVAGSRFEEK